MEVEAILSKQQERSERRVGERQESGEEGRG